MHHEIIYKISMTAKFVLHQFFNNRHPQMNQVTRTIKMYIFVYISPFE